MSPVVFVRLKFEIILLHGSCTLVKISSLVFKVSLWCVPTKTWQLEKIETPKIYSLFGSRLGPLQVRDC